MARQVNPLQHHPHGQVMPSQATQFSSEPPQHFPSGLPPLPATMHHHNHHHQLLQQQQQQQQQLLQQQQTARIGYRMHGPPTTSVGVTPGIALGGGNFHHHSRPPFPSTSGSSRPSHVQSYNPPATQQGPKVGLSDSAQQATQNRPTHFGSLSSSAFTYGSKYIYMCVCFADYGVVRRVSYRGEGGTLVSPVIDLLPCACAGVE